MMPMKWTLAMTSLASFLAALITPLYGAATLSFVAFFAFARLVDDDDELDEFVVHTAGFGTTCRANLIQLAPGAQQTMGRRAG